MFAAARNTISPLASPTLRNFAHSTPPARVGLAFNFPIPVASGSGAHSITAFDQAASACRPTLRRMNSSYMLNSSALPHTPRLGSMADYAPMSPFILTPSSLATDDGYFLASSSAKKSVNMKAVVNAHREAHMQTSTGSIAPKATEISTASRIARWTDAYAPTPSTSKVERIGLGISGLTLGSTPTGNCNRTDSFSSTTLNTQNANARNNTFKSVAFGADVEEDSFADTEADTMTSLKRRRRRSSYSSSLSLHPRKLAKLVQNGSIPIMQFTESGVSSLNPHLSTPLPMPITPSLRSSSVLPPFVL